MLVACEAVTVILHPPAFRVVPLIMAQRPDLGNRALYRVDRVPCVPGWMRRLLLHEVHITVLLEELEIAYLVKI
jgi:hypothetical protein